MKTHPRDAATLFDDPEEVSSRILSDEFDDDDDPTETYAGRAERVRNENLDW